MSLGARARAQSAQPFRHCLVRLGVVLFGMAFGGCGDSSDEGGCDEGTAQCAGECVNVQSDVRHCGACGVSCADGEVCRNAGCEQACVQCGDRCVFTDSDPQNCGACGTACSASTQCLDGACRCPAGGLSCGELCIDETSDLQHCGACNNACAPGQSCQMGQCVCPEGSQLCESACRNLQTDRQHCGSCGLACAEGDECVAGACVGPDGCASRLASGVTIDEVSAYQTVRVPLVGAGKPVENEPLLLVHDKPALLSVSLELANAGVTRDLSVRVKLRAADGKLSQFFVKPRVSQSTSAQTPESTLLIPVTGDALRTGASYSLEAIDCAAAPAAPDSAMSGARVPQAGSAPLPVHDPGPLTLMLIPVHAGGVDPDVSPAALEGYARWLNAYYPVAKVEVTAASPLVLARGGAPLNQYFEDVLRTLVERREAEAPGDTVYYYGLVRLTQSREEWCEGESVCTGGVGFLNTNIFPATNVATGMAFAEEESARVMAHELAHNHGRAHAPCGNPPDLDPNFPYSESRISKWGYDALNQRFMPPEAYDLMGYCMPQWVSDYTYRGLFTRIAEMNDRPLPNASRLGRRTTRLAGKTRWQGAWLDARGARWTTSLSASSSPDLEPVPLVILDELGQAVAHARGFGIHVEHTGSQLVLVPPAEAGWHAVRIGQHELGFAEAPR